jgi:3-oxoacyl-[acyl-carrier-protein] synthase II
MRDAHSRAQISPVDVDLLMAHGTGTVLNDLTEAQAILEVFGDFAGQVPVCGLKSLIGHTSGASGLIGVVTAIECLHYGRIPPTAGFETPMDEAKRLRIVYGTAKEAVLNVAQINAFGFGGVNAVAIIEKVLK